MQHLTNRMQEAGIATVIRILHAATFHNAASWVKECRQCDLTANFLVQHFTIKMQEGVVATSYAAGDKFFIDPYKLLPMDRFLPKPKGAPSPGGRGKSGAPELHLQGQGCVCGRLTGLLTAVTCDVVWTLLL